MYLHLPEHFLVDLNFSKNILYNSIILYIIVYNKDFSDSTRPFLESILIPTPEIFGGIDISFYNIQISLR